MIKKNIPNAITCCNLICGSLAVIKACEGDLIIAACLVGFSLVFDFFDGFTARMLKVSSAIGKDLDSLADMVTFGVVPGIVMYKLIATAIFDPLMGAPAKEGWTIYPAITAANAGSYLPYLGLIITVFSCIRLAKFNNDTRQSDSFIGVPTPANTMVICALPLIVEFQPGYDLINALIANPYALIGLSLLMSFLLVAEIPLFALKFKSFAWSANKLVYCFLAVSVVLLATLHFVAVPLVILLYILLSIANNLRPKAQG